MPISRLLLPFENSCHAELPGEIGLGAAFRHISGRNAGSIPRVKNSREIMTSHELLLALVDEDTLELARRMIRKPRLAFLLVKEANLA